MYQQSHILTAIEAALSLAATVAILGWLRSSSHSLMVLARAARRAERVADLFLVFGALESAEKLFSVL